MTSIPIQYVIRVKTEPKLLESIEQYKYRTTTTGFSRIMFNAFCKRGSKDCYDKSGSENCLSHWPSNDEWMNEQYKILLNKMESKRNYTQKKSTYKVRQTDKPKIQKK